MRVGISSASPSTSNGFESATDGGGALKSSILLSPFCGFFGATAEVGGEEGVTEESISFEAESTEVETAAAEERGGAEGCCL